MKKIVWFLICIPLLLTSCKTSTEQEDITMLLVKANELNRLELAANNVRTKIRINPNNDGQLGWKKVFGRRETVLEINTRVSAYCDFSQINQSSIHKGEDGTYTIKLPEITIVKEMEDLKHRIVKEADPMRSPLSENEIEEILHKKREIIQRYIDGAIEKVKPQMIASAHKAAERRLSQKLSEMELPVKIIY